MKRILTLTLCCLGAAALLVSCGGNAAKKAEPAAAEAAVDYEREIPSNTLANLEGPTE